MSQDVEGGVKQALAEGVLAERDALDELIDMFAPAEKVIEVTVGVKAFRFKAIVDRRDWNSLIKRAKDFVTANPASLVPPALPEAKDWLDTDADTKTYAFVLDELSIEPKLDKIRLLKVAKEAFLAFDQLKDGYLKGLAWSRSDAEQAEVERRKNESSETSVGATA